MDPIRNIKLRWLHGALQDVTYELSRSQFSRFAPHAWEPAINAYRCEKCIRICVDLAGVDRSLIDLTVEPRRVVIRGTRELPEPTDDEGCALQLLAMEIDYGPFIREVPLPAEVEIEEAHAEQRNGLLWISLPVERVMSAERTQHVASRASNRNREPQSTIAAGIGRKPRCRKSRRSYRFCQCADLSFFRERLFH